MCWGVGIWGVEPLENFLARLFIGVVTPFRTGRGLPCRTSFRITKEILLNSNGPTIELALRIMGSQQVVISRS